MRIPALPVAGCQLPVACFLAAPLQKVTRGRCRVIVPRVIDCTPSSGASGPGRRAGVAAVALVVAALGGCGDQDAPPAQRLWTLFDLERIFLERGSVARGTVSEGIPGGYFVADRDADGALEIALNLGYIEGRAAIYATTEMWSNVDEIWVQPIYRPMRGDGSRIPGAPWIFGVGPGSKFYSPFWEVYTFVLPDEIDAATVLDTRRVLEIAGRTGGLHMQRARITTLAPATVGEPRNSATPGPREALVPAEVLYADDTAAWEGEGGHRYIDFGPGRFTYGPSGVVDEVPIFMFVVRDPLTGAFSAVQDGAACNVGGTRPLYSQAPPVDVPAPPPAPGDPEPPVRAMEPRFGGLWRLHVVEVEPDVTVQPDGRVVRDGEVLDSQAAIEALGPNRIHRTEILAACPLVQLGDRQFIFTKGAF
jgi:hypothetical protein